MRPARAIATALLTVIAFAGVTLFVAWLLGDVIHFSLFVGIPAGLLATAAVLVACLLKFQPAEAPMPSQDPYRRPPGV